MDKLKQWIALTALAAVAIMAAGWFLLISPKKAESAELQVQTAAQESTNQTLQAQLAVLKAQAKDLPKKQAELARVAAKIPDNPGLPALIRALTLASTTAGVDFVSVTPGAPVPVTAPVAAAVVAPAGTTASPAAEAAAPAVRPAGAAGGVAGTLLSIPVALNVVGDYFEVEQFLAELEGLPRAFKVSNLSLAPGTSPTARGEGATSTEDGRSLTSTITGTVFMAAGRPAATAVVAPSAAPAK